VKIRNVSKETLASLGITDREGRITTEQTLSSFGDQMHKVQRDMVQQELERLFADIDKQGKALGNNFYKIRLYISSKGKGKSGGARIITYVKIISASVYLISIYDKSEKVTITDKELEQIFKIIP
jgi:hypothetical protein